MSKTKRIFLVILTLVAIISICDDPSESAQAQTLGQQQTNQQQNQRRSPTPQTVPTNNSISWTSNTGTFLEADNFYIQTQAGQVFSKPDPGNSVELLFSDKGDGSYTTLNVAWRENGTYVSLFLYFTRIQETWKVSYGGFYQGTSPNQVVYPTSTQSQTVGSVLVIPGSYELSGQGGKVHFDRLRLAVVFNLPPRVSGVTRTSVYNQLSVHGDYLHFYNEPPESVIVTLLNTDGSLYRRFRRFDGIAGWSLSSISLTQGIVPRDWSGKLYLTNARGQSNTIDVPPINTGRVQAPATRQRPECSETEVRGISASNPGNWASFGNGNWTYHAVETPTGTQRMDFEAPQRGELKVNLHIVPRGTTVNGTFATYQCYPPVP